MNTALIVVTFPDPSSKAENPTGDRVDYAETEINSAATLPHWALHHTSA